MSRMYNPHGGHWGGVYSGSASASSAYSPNTLSVSSISSRQFRVPGARNIDPDSVKLDITSENVSSPDGTAGLNSVIKVDRRYTGTSNRNLSASAVSNGLLSGFNVITYRLYNAVGSTGVSLSELATGANVSALTITYICEEA